MIVAQRLRELALLRAIGASRRQVNRSVLLEAGAGRPGRQRHRHRRRRRAGLRPARAAEQLQRRPAVRAAAVAAAHHHRRAGGRRRGHRVQRLRPGPAGGQDVRRSPRCARSSPRPARSLRRAHDRRRRVRRARRAGPARPAAPPRPAAARPAWSGIGALLLIVGVLLGAPALSRPIVGVVGAVVAAPFGAVGRLARTNAVRNPRRTAATAFALTLGPDAGDRHRGVRRRRPSSSINALGGQRRHRRLHPDRPERDRRADRGRAGGGQGARRAERGRAAPGRRQVRRQRATRAPAWTARSTRWPATT